MSARQQEPKHDETRWKPHNRNAVYLHSQIVCPEPCARSSKNCPSHSGYDLEATVTGFGMLELVASFICLTTLLTYVNYRFIGLPLPSA